MRLLAALLLAALSGAGCHTDQVAASMRVESRDALAAVAAARGRARGPVDRYVAVRGKRKAPGTAFAQLTPDVWAPFDVSIRTGLFDPDRMATADGTRVCLEIDDVGFTVFYDVCAVYDAAQSAWNLSAFTGAPVVNLPGSLSLDGPEIELRIETDGAMLRFHGRLADEPTWSLVAETGWPGQTEALEAAFGAGPVAKGTEVGFDDPSFASAAPPSPPTGAGAAAAAANQALLEGLAAFLLLDGGSPDFAAAATRLDAAGDALADARAALAALPPDGTTKKAARDLAKAAKKLGAAAGDVAEQDADGALKSLGKAGAKVEKAVLRLAPQPLDTTP